MFSTCWASASRILYSPVPGVMSHSGSCSCRASLMDASTSSLRGNICLLGIYLCQEGKVLVGPSGDGSLDDSPVVIDGGVDVVYGVQDFLLAVEVEPALKLGRTNLLHLVLLVEVE